ncbi:MAG: hypothetical protein HY567_04685 [Candidatus Kerfeldbacteria bacterium]|nr:hypothetical protein [Candidatus Kerfeldbacteria bacterium]
MNPRVVLTIAIALIVAGAASLMFARHQTNEASVVSTANNTNRAVNTNSGLVPRTLPQKPAHATVPPGNDPHVISVKFMDDLDIKISPNGYPVGRTDTVLQSTEAASLMELIKKAGGKWLPASSTLEQEGKIDDLRAEAEKSGHAIADLNNYFTLIMPDREETTKWMDLLNALPEVEIATPAVLTQTAPAKK